MCWCNKKGKLPPRQCIRACAWHSCCGYDINGGHHPQCGNVFPHATLVPNTPETPKVVIPIDEVLKVFPSFSALDLFCNKCARVMRYSLSYNINRDAIEMKSYCHGREFACWVTEKHLLDHPDDVKVQIRDALNEWRSEG